MNLLTLMMIIKASAAKNMLKAISETVVYSMSASDCKYCF